MFQKIKTQFSELVKSRRSKRDRSRNGESGLAALELALLMPILFGIMYGAVATFDLLRAHNQVSNASTTLADLSTRVLFMNDTQRDNFYAAAESLMPKFGSPSSFNMSITSVEADDPDTSPTGSSYRVIWSESQDGTSTLDVDDLNALDLPTLDDTESIIIVVIDSTYVSDFALFQGNSNQDTHQNLSTITSRRVAVRRPRFVSKILYQ